jgi:UDP-glucuronate 4-epimerase
LPNRYFDPYRPDPPTAAAPYRINNNGNHSPGTLTRFIDDRAAIGRKAERRLLPSQPGDVPATYAEVQYLADAIGFTPRTSIEDGIARFVDWYRSFYGITNAKAIDRPPS